MTLLELLQDIDALVREFIQTRGQTREEIPAEVSRGKNMCGSIRASQWADKSPVVVGSALPENAEIVLDGKALSKPTIWQGFSKSEVLDKWKNGGWKEAVLKVDGFNEQGYDFPVPEGKGIRVVVLERPAGSFLNIVTRASTPEETKIHPRMPELADLPIDETPSK